MTWIWVNVGSGNGLLPGGSKGWTNIDTSLIWFTDIHLSAISQEIPQPSITKISLKITYLKFDKNFSGGQIFTIKFSISGGTVIQGLIYHEIFTCPTSKISNFPTQSIYDLEGNCGQLVILLPWAIGQWDMWSPVSTKFWGLYMYMYIYKYILTNFYLKGQFIMMSGQVQSRLTDILVISF